MIKEYEVYKFYAIGNIWLEPSALFEPEIRTNLAIAAAIIHKDVASLPNEPWH